MHYKYWCFVAIRAIINEIAGGTAPNFGRVKPKDEKSFKARKKVLEYCVKKSLGGPHEHEDFEPYEHDHPVVTVFRNPNANDVAYDLWAYHTLFLCLTGEAHWWVMRNEYDVPVEIWVIPTHWMRLMTDYNGQPSRWYVQSPWGHAMDIPYDEVVNFYDHSPLNRYEGWAVNQGVSEWIDTYEAKTRMQLAIFKNGAIPAFHVSLGEAYADPDEQFLARFYSKWLARFQGEDNSGKPLITGADVTVTAIEGSRPAEALMAGIQTEEAIRDMVLSAYGVPKGVVGIDPTNDTSAYAPQRQFTRFTINPRLHYMGQVIQEKVVKRTRGCEDGVCFWDDRVPNDQELIEAQIASDWDRGAITAQEIRALRGRDEYPLGGENPFVNGVEMEWVKKQERKPTELEDKFAKAMAEGGGSTGGFGVPSMSRFNSSRLNGKPLRTISNGKH